MQDEIKLTKIMFEGWITILHTELLISTQSYGWKGLDMVAEATIGEMEQCFPDLDKETRARLIHDTGELGRYWYHHLYR